MQARRTVDVSPSHCWDEVPPASPTAATLHRVQFELSHDRAGSRLRQIGDLQISYDWGGTRPKALGQFALDYDMAGNRLRHVGADQVDYDKLGSRPARFGELDLQYDRLGSRLIRIGNMRVVQFLSHSMRSNDSVCRWRSPSWWPGWPATARRPRAVPTNYPGRRRRPSPLTGARLTSLRL